MATDNHGLSFVLEHHTFGVRKGVKGSLCVYCGLVRTNNFLTEFAIKYGCNWHEHPRARWAIEHMPRQWQERRNG